MDETRNVSSNVLRGAIFWVVFELARDVEQMGRRPALVVQNNRGNRNSSYTIVAAISSAHLNRIYPFAVPLKAGDANLTRNCHVNCAQLLTIYQSRLDGYIGLLSQDKMNEVEAALRFEFDL